MQSISDQPLTKPLTALTEDVAPSSGPGRILLGVFATLDRPGIPYCRLHQFWIPTPKLEFGCYLVKKIAKGHLDDEQGRRLSRLYQQDPSGCQQQVARFWEGGFAALIVAAAGSGDWEPVRRRLEELRA